MSEQELANIIEEIVPMFADSAEINVSTPEWSELLGTAKHSYLTKGMLFSLILYTASKASLDLFYETLPGVIKPGGETIPENLKQFLLADFIGLSIYRALTDTNAVLLHKEDKEEFYQGLITGLENVLKKADILKSHRIEFHRVVQDSVEFCQKYDHLYPYETDDVTETALWEFGKRLGARYIKDGENPFFSVLLAQYNNSVVKVLDVDGLLGV